MSRATTVHERASAGTRIVLGLFAHDQPRPDDWVHNLVMVGGGFVPAFRCRLMSRTEASVCSQVYAVELKSGICAKSPQPYSNMPTQSCTFTFKLLADLCL